MNTRIHKGLAVIAMLFGLVFVITNAVAKKPIKPPPKPEPVLTQPAFAYYCKSNPNSGAICLANEDGSAPVKIFTTSKFQGSKFNIAAFQNANEGKVLVEDIHDLWSIEYTVDLEGFLVSVEDPLKLIEGGIDSMDWSPSGDDFAILGSNPEGIHLGSRIDYDTGELGNPIVVMPASPSPLELDGEAFGSLAWSADGETIYFIKSCYKMADYGWQELHKAEIGDYIEGGTQNVTQCLLAIGYPGYADTSYCSEIDHNLTRLYFVSHSDDGLMVSARGMNHVASDPEETYYTYILDDGGAWEEIPTPEFRGYDWTSDGTIIGQTDDDEILTFDPETETGVISILIKKNATSPDWAN